MGTPREGDAHWPGPLPAPLLDHFAALEDPRQRAKVLHPLPEILLLLLAATLAGADDFVEIGLWGMENLAFLRRLLAYRHGVPSHDTLGEVIAALDPELFKGCFTAWVEGLREAEPDLVAIDGKTSRRTHDRGKGREPLHLVSAWASRQRLVLGQEAVGGKSNEIAAIPLLLERLALDGALVTIDAIGAQNAIAATILRRGGDYLLALKANRPATLKDVETFFADPPPGTIETHATTDGEHGRIEVRRHAVCHDVTWMFSARHYPGEPTFPGLAMIGMVESDDPAGRQNLARAPLLSLLRQARCRHFRPRGARPLGHREPAALGARRGVQGRPRPPAHRPRAGEHGGGQAHGREPAAPSRADRLAQEPPQARRLEHRLSRDPHPPDRVNPTVHPIALRGPGRPGARNAEALGEATAPAEDQEFVLYHSDNVEATGFVEHLKLPHYVDFQAELETVRRLRARPRRAMLEDAAEMSADTGYSFAYLDEQTKRMIRRALLKAVAIPGYQVPFASREMPLP